MTSFSTSCACTRRACLAGGLTGLLTWLAPMGSWAQPVVDGLQRHALPDLGDGQGMSLSEELRLGQDIARQLYRDPGFVDDPLLADHVQNVWQALMRAAQIQGDVPEDMAQRLAWQILLAKDPSINAFALPGGYMGLHLGLLAEVESTDELASVMAHELSHICQRHIARMLERQRQQAPWMLAGMILGALAASQSKTGDIAQATMVGGQALALQGQLNFSRDMEREADRIGLGIHTGAGFAPQAFVGMFGKLQQASRLNDTGAYPYLRSHPLTTERMADMSNRVGHLPAMGVSAEARQVHALMAARAKVLADEAVSNHRAWMAQQPGPLASDAQRWQLHALGAFAALRLRDAGQWRVHTLALSHMQTPATADVWPSMGLLGWQTWPQQAEAHAAWPQSLTSLVSHGLGLPARGAMLTAAQTVLSLRLAPQTAIERLQAHVSAHATDATAWQTLAGLYQLAGQPVRAARAEAEVSVSHLDWQGAFDRLRSAQSLARQSRERDDFELAIIDSRTRWVQAELRAYLALHPPRT